MKSFHQRNCKSVFEKPHISCLNSDLILEKSGKYEKLNLQDLHFIFDSETKRKLLFCCIRKWIKLRS
ncbi:MAG: hypothetical protein D6687_06245 [Acidobacteria bacterium]|nr:MAG: hypothetical protein D6687_06245 [Acidobacteriota bacterium]